MLEVGAEPGCLDAVHDLIAAVARDAQVSEDVRIRFETAAMEILANIIEHGAAEQPVLLSLTVAVRDRWLRGEFSDDAPPAMLDPEMFEMPDPLADRGRGLAIATHLLDQFQYLRENDRNVWRLGVQLPAEKS